MELLFISLDEEYVNIIEAALGAGISGGIDISVISDAQYLAEYAKSDHKVDLLIVDEKCLDYTEKIIAENKVVVIEKNEISEGYVYKYGGAQAVLRGIPEGFIKSGGLNESKLIKVATVTGGSGKTTTAIGVANALFGIGRKVLYMSAENIQNFAWLIDESKYLPEDIVKTFTRPARLSADQILMAAEKNGFDYIPEIRGILSSWQISLDMILNIAKEICKKKIYDYVVLEMPREVTTRDDFSAHANESVVITMTQDSYSKEKTQRFIELMGYDTKDCVLVCGKYRETGTVLGESIGNCLICERIKYDDNGAYRNAFVKTAFAIS